MLPPQRSPSPSQHKALLILRMGLIAVLLASCSVSTPTSTPPLVSPTTTPLSGVVTRAIGFSTPASTPTQQPSPTARPPGTILWVPQGADPILSSELETEMRLLADANAFRFESRPSLTSADLAPDTWLVVALPPDPDISTLAAAASNTQFVAVGIPGLSPTPNLSLIGPQGLRYDQQGFIAGYLAAMITDDWRVGVISHADTIAGRAARQGFLNGTIFFCGLCRPAFPPFAGYPLFVEVSGEANIEAQRAAVDQLLAAGVTTVYIHPSTLDPEVVDDLLANDVTLIGGDNPSPAWRVNWAATIRPDPSPSLAALWPRLIAGEGGQALPLMYILKDINPQLLSPGRERVVKAAIVDLETGAVDTGVDPQTSEQR